MTSMIVRVLVLVRTTHHQSPKSAAPTRGATRVTSMAMLAEPDTQPDTAAIHSYLAAVYPAARSSLDQMNPRQLARRFDSLDYYYSSTSASSLRPPFTLDHADEVPILPCVPQGAFYRASGHAPMDAGRFNAVLWGVFDRHTLPVQLLRDPLHGAAAGSFLSSFGARLGPQPSWTSPLAIARYVHYPNGLEHASLVNGSLRKATLSRAQAGDAHQFDVAINSPAVARLKRLRDGDVVEVEQWGGLLNADECPPICGLWANVWTGTGVMMRVRRPFVSLNKPTALLEMFARLGARNASALESVRDLMGVAPAVKGLQRRHADATLADCLGASMLSHVPRSGGGHVGMHFGLLAREWEKFVEGASPRDIVRRFVRLGAPLPSSSGPVASSSHEPLLSHAAGRFALYWTFGISGKGKFSPFWREAPVGPDSLLATLACALGHHTVVLAAASNDNGLLHQELVDFEMPEPLGWPDARGAATNDVRWCATQPFSFVQEDALRAGSGGIPSGQAWRRQHMLNFWRTTGKFRLATDPGGPPSQPTQPCGLSFGSDRNVPEGSLLACRGPKTRVPRPSAANACWAWCNGTLSETALSGERR